MPFLDANGVRFHVQRMGRGAPLVLSHGLLVGSLTTWFFTIAPALARRHDVLLYDLRGHGLSERPSRGYDLTTQVDDLEALVAQTFGVAGRVSLGGHSYGALVALTFARRHPERVARLALVESPLPPFSRDDNLQTVVGRTPEEMLASLPPQIRAAFAQPGRRARRFVDRIAALVRDTSLIDDLHREPEVSDGELARVGCPVVLVYGARSSCRPVGERLARVMPRATLELIEGGHFLPRESTPAVTATLERFFDG